ncbi:restriction endonuclease [Spirosoma utsteinense]|uniref:restriction endonuclease n=1 Tax=Spirosoma utsteinense TaxID=2585773 RepID=UPI00164918C1|nr:DEAD/DEAH box helicase family protein [Spirosoma utsteinense]MBC3788642.1 type III restriction enzyme [Spirosoma utsteinense]
MKIQFEKNQAYQLEAIQSVIDLFEGQNLNNSDFEFTLDDSGAGSIKFTEIGIGNQLTILPEQLLENLHKVQVYNELSQSLQLEYLSFKGETGAVETTDFGNYSVEMETGTGKTYVYLRSVYELNKVYGFKKFVIVVPSVAIREGVVKNLEITFEHFKEIYENVPAAFEVYDSKKVAGLSNFARSNAIQILVINIDSFAKDDNIINKPREGGIRPIQNLQSTSPIVIVDEPQNMETELRKKAIASLNPLFTLRYSATHTNAYNLVYKLDPVRAYDLGLVKQIEVDSVLSQNDNGGAFVSLEGFKLAKKSLSATLTILKADASGVSKKSVIAKNGDNLYQLSGGVEAYKDGYVINALDSAEGMVEFSSGTVLYRGEPHGSVNDEIQKEMIRATIENHFKKERELNPLNIKVLSVFFIDKVANYRSYDNAGKPVAGKFALWFEEIFAEQIKNPRYKNLYPYAVSDMHDGYFSQDKGKFKDTSEGRSTKADDETYRLIMKDKEKLLDMNTPLRFIFSHSALREGWDNPNVFQICTLNETKSEIRKRQEIGRGLRLCVDQSGARNTERTINRLTVVANESYEDFAKALQKEIEQDCGVSFKGRIKDARKRQTVQLKKNWELDKNFLDLWERIKHKTEYKVNYDTNDLIKNAAAALGAMPAIPKPMIQRIKTETKFIRDDNNELLEVGGDIKSSKFQTIPQTRYDIPDFVGYILARTELTRATISEILLQSTRLSEIFNNPQLFMDSVVKVVKTEFDKLKINGIKYEKIAGQSYEMQLFDDNEIESYLDNLIVVKKQEKTLYNYVLIDSLSDPERKFAEECENRDDILFYIKLPSWFVIKTPIGNYNPDWALIKQEDEEAVKIYFVAETKSAKAVKDKTLLRESERMKIICGEKHFAEFGDVGFAAVGSVSDI